jgi:FkbM family methyltransferase
VAHRQKVVFRDDLAGHSVGSTPAVTVTAPGSRDRTVSRLHAISHSRVPLVSTVAKAAFSTLVVVGNPLAGRRRVRAASRFWTWQVWRRTIGRSVDVTLPGGGTLRCPAWSRMAGGVVANGLPEPDDQQFLLAVVRSGDRFVDVGANIGIWSVLAGRRGCRVVAFEPSDQARHMLEWNLEANGLSPQSEVFACAVGEHDGLGQLTTGLDIGNHLVVDNPVPGTVAQVEVRSLDRVFAAPEAAGGGLTVLKIDAEGHDEGVLAGAGHLLAGTKPIVIVEVWDGGREIRARLAGFGYDAFHYDSDRAALTDCPAEFRGEGNLILATVDRKAVVDDRLRDRPRIPMLPPRVRWLVSAGDPGRGHVPALGRS